MSKIIDISEILSNKTLDKDTIKLWNLANTIDKMLIDCIKDGNDPQEIAVVLSNRLGEMCKAIHASTGVDILKHCLDLIEKQYKRT